MSQILVNINAEILKWAREESGFNIPEIAEKLEISKDKYVAWENTGNKIPLGKLKEVATFYKRQLAVFFLPNIPIRTQKPKDYRNLRGDEKKLSRKVLMVLRDVNHFKHIAIRLKGEAYWETKFDWLKQIQSSNLSVEQIVSWLRDRLKFTIDDQINWTSTSQAYKKWRQRIEEELGILIFQYSMPINEVQGFCLTNSLPYVIVTNSNHQYTGRIFTIFHEMAHIIRHQSGLCLVDRVGQNQTEEWQCNGFSASFLIPDNLLVDADTLEEISKYARTLNVSREAYLRRLKDASKISERKFYQFLIAIRSSYITIKKSKTSAPILPEVKSKASRGETFYNMVLEGINTNEITYTEASSVLSLSVNRLLHEV